MYLKKLGLVVRIPSEERFAWKVGGEWLFKLFCILIFYEFITRIEGKDDYQKMVTKSSANP